jgi:hypothetical protein
LVGDVAFNSGMSLTYLYVPDALNVSPGGTRGVRIFHPARPLHLGACRPGAGASSDLLARCVAGRGGVPALASCRPADAQPRRPTRRPTCRNHRLPEQPAQIFRLTPAGTLGSQVVPRGVYDRVFSPDGYGLPGGASLMGAPSHFREQTLPELPLKSSESHPPARCAPARGNP